MSHICFLSSSVKFFSHIPLTHARTLFFYVHPQLHGFLIVVTQILSIDFPDASFSVALTAHATRRASVNLCTVPGISRYDHSFSSSQSLSDVQVRLLLHTTSPPSDPLLPPPFSALLVGSSLPEMAGVIGNLPIP
jgi:hypothetical protein